MNKSPKKLWKRSLGIVLTAVMVITAALPTAAYGVELNARAGGFSEAIAGNIRINIQRTESRLYHIFFFIFILSVPSCYIKNKHFRPYSTPQIRSVRMPTDFQNLDLSIGRSPTIFPV